MFHEYLPERIDTRFIYIYGLTLEFTVKASSLTTTIEYRFLADSELTTYDEVRTVILKGISGDTA